MAAPARARRARRRNVRLETPSPQREREFLDAVRRSRGLLRPWVYPPSTPAAYAAWLRRVRQPTQEGHLVVERASDALVGVVDVTAIGVRSASLGCYAFLPYAGRGGMTQALELVLSRMFGPLGLHRVEANIQPENEASRRLVLRLGFEREGTSPCYLRVGRHWRDHERWALVAESWRAARRASVR